MANESNFKILVKLDPRIIANGVDMQEYYSRFFAAKPDFVFAIGNAPSYILMVHPEFQKEYKLIWLKNRKDAFRGIYLIYARINDSCVKNIDFSKTYIN